MNRWPGTGVGIGGCVGLRHFQLGRVGEAVFRLAGRLAVRTAGVGPRGGGGGVGDLSPVVGRRHVGVMVKVTVPPGAITRVTPVGKPVVALAGVAVVPAPVVAVVQPPSATICAGTGSVKVAWAIVEVLVLVTVTV